MEIFVSGVHHSSFLRSLTGPVGVKSSRHAVYNWAGTWGMSFPLCSLLLLKVCSHNNFLTNFRQGKCEIYYCWTWMSLCPKFS